MPDRHSELPAHPDLEYYRKQARHLQRSYEAGDAAARARAAEVLGDRAAGRFLLSDAQFVLAQEHGFRTWAEFRADIQSQRTTGDRPVSRLWGTPGSYASQADGLLTELRRGDPDALQRLRAQVPRYAAATDASTAELRDARLIIARELGFPTWREIVEAAGKSQRDEAERQERWRRMRPEAEALLAGDTARLAQLTAGQADTLLQILAGREILGTKPGQGLGAPRAAVDMLIGKATRLDLPLDRAVRSDRVEYVRLLLDAGADPGTRTDGTTPLENAIGVGNTQMVDLLAEHGIIPAALWTYAACGRLDLVQACFVRTAGYGPTPRCRAPTPPASSLSRPGSRRHPIRRRSWPRRSSTPASTAGPRSCAGSSTAARTPTSPPSSGIPDCTWRSCTSGSRWSACSWSVAPTRPSAARCSLSTPPACWPFSPPSTAATP